MNIRKAAYCSFGLNGSVLASSCAAALDLPSQPSSLHNAALDMKATPSFPHSSLGFVFGFFHHFHEGNLSCVNTVFLPLLWLSRARASTGLPLVHSCGSELTLGTCHKEAERKAGAEGVQSVFTGTLGLLEAPG